MTPALVLGLYCVLIAAASWAGGYLPLRLKLGHTSMQLLMSAVAGFMFGVALLHMLGHALVDAPIQLTLLWLLAGFLVMFFTERFFAFHVHDPRQAEAMMHGQPVDACDDPEHHHHGGHHPHAARLSWTGATIGMTIHSLIGGIALAAAFAAELATQSQAHTGHDPAVGTVAGWAGLPVFLAIVLHKPLDALTITSLAKGGGLSHRAALRLNAGFALVVPIGVLLAYLGLTAAFDHPQYLAYALAFSAGTFICVALSDLLPEVQFHQHDRVKLSAALLIGLALAWGVGVLEHALGDPHAHRDGSHATPVDHTDHEGHAH